MQVLLVVVGNKTDSEIRMEILTMYVLHMSNHGIDCLSATFDSPHHENTAVFRSCLRVIHFSHQHPLTTPSRFQSTSTIS